MPKGEGWFIDLRNGEHISIFEHQLAVRQNPARYRVTPEEIAGKQRADIVGLALRRGFVRVRADKERLVAEFNAPADEALPHIQRFLRDKGFIGYRQLRLRDHRIGRQVECTADEFLNDSLSPEDWVPMSASPQKGRRTGRHR